MDGEQRRSRVRSFLLGGLVGASAAFAAARSARQWGRPRPAQAGLQAFEGAPCFEEALERERKGASTSPS
jgi:hypothetical protein